jgi:hypothetical protein
VEQGGNSSILAVLGDTDLNGKGELVGSRNAAEEDTD